MGFFDFLKKNKASADGFGSKGNNGLIDLKLSSKEREQLANIVSSTGRFMGKNLSDVEAMVKSGKKMDIKVVNLCKVCIENSLMETAMLGKPPLPGLSGLHTKLDEILKQNEGKA